MLYLFFFALVGFRGESDLLKLITSITYILNEVSQLGALLPLFSLPQPKRAQKDEDTHPDGGGVLQLGRIQGPLWCILPRDVRTIQLFAN